MRLRLKPGFFLEVDATATLCVCNSGILFLKALQIANGIEAANQQLASITARVNPANVLPYQEKYSSGVYGDVIETHEHKGDFKEP